MLPHTSTAVSERAGEFKRELHRSHSGARLETP